MPNQDQSQESAGALPGRRFIYAIIWTAIGVIVVVNLTVNLLWLSGFANSLTAQNVRAQGLQAQRAKALVEYEAAKAQADLSRLAYFLSLDNRNGTSTERLIEQTLKNNFYIREIALADGQGQEFARYSRSRLITGADLKNLAGLDVFEKARQGQIYASPVNFSSYAEPFFTLVRPIGGENRATVLLADFYLRGLWEMALEMRIGETGEISVIDSKGILVANPRPANVLKKLNYISRPPVKNLLSGQTAEGLRYQADGKDLIGTAYPFLINESRWTLLVEQEAREIEGAKDKIKGWLLVFCGGNLLLAGILVWLMLVLKGANRELAQRYAGLLRAREKLAMAKQKIKSALDNVSSPIMVFDKNYALADFNLAAAGAFGLGAADLNKKATVRAQDFSFAGLVAIIKPPFRSRIKSRAAGGWAEEEEAVFGARPSSNGNLDQFQDLGPDYRIYKILTAPLRAANGAEQGFVVTAQDLTREKLLDQLKSEFISIAAHQLRTPLSAVKWTLKMLMDEDEGPLNDGQKNLVNKGFQSNERVIKLVNELLNVSRLEEGKFDYKFAVFDFSRFYKELADSVWARASLSGLQFTAGRPPADLPVKADKEKISLALEAVLDNSLKYTPAGGTIKMAMTADRAVGRLAIAITDSGIGIPAAEQAKLFSKFFRGSNVLKMETDGSGLGLYLARNIIARHGGSLTVSSQEKQGTLVKIELPFLKG